MSLREQAVTAAATAADKAKQYAEGKRDEKRDKVHAVLNEALGIEAEFVYAEKLDVVIERSRQYGGTYIEEKVADVFGFLADGIKFAFVTFPQGGGESAHWTLESTCKQCGGRAFLSRGQSGNVPHGYGLHLYPPSNAEMHARSLQEIGETLQLDGYCNACLLRLPKECPSCRHKIRT